MPKTTTEKIQLKQEQIEQCENQLKKLLKQQKDKEQRERTRRLIQRGAIVESLIENPTSMTNEQFKAYIANALTARKPTVKSDFPVKKTSSG